MARESDECDKEVWIELHDSVGVKIQLNHPAIDAIRIKLLVPRCVEGIGEVYTVSVAADLHHLRAAIQWLVGLRWMSSAAHDAARMYGANPLRMEWIGNIVLDKFSRSPARCIEVAVIDGKIDVGQQRSHGLEAFQDVWELRRIGRLCGNFNDLLNGPGAVGLVP